MRDLGFGQIILLIVLILVPLFRYVQQRVRRRLEDQIPEQELPEEESVTENGPQAEAPPAPLPAPRASRTEFHASQAPAVAPPLSRRRFSKRSLLGTQRDVRRGIILMTILGPCRAFDSPESRRVENVV